MHATEVVASALRASHGFADALFRDLADKPFTRTAPSGGKHAYWLLGHLVVSEGAVLDEYLLGRSCRYQRWVSLFGIGTDPKDQSEGGPPYQELLTELESVRQSTLEFVSGLIDTDLDRPCHSSDWPGPKFGSIGECLSSLALHTGIHAGQLTCARSADGRGPLFPFRTVEVRP